MRVRLRTGTRVTAALAMTLAVATPGTADVAPENVRVTSGMFGGYQQPSVALDPTEPGRMAIAFQEANQLRTCYLAVGSVATGWDVVPLVGVGGRFPPPALISDERFCWNPMVAYGPEGNLYYVFQDGFYFGRGEGGIYLIVYDKARDVFVPPVRIWLDPTAHNFWPAIAVDQSNGRLWVSWTRAAYKTSPMGTGPVLVASSSDAGRTFSPPVATSPLHAQSTGSFIAVGKGGDVYVTYSTIAGSFPRGDIFVAVSRDDGLTFGSSAVGTTAIGFGGFDRLTPDGAFRKHSLATDPVSGRAYVAWWDKTAANLGRVTVRATADAGVTWTAPQVVGVPEGGESDHYHRPWLSVAPNGRLDLVYYVREATNAEQDGPQDVLFTFSGDGGVTFAAPRKLTDVPSPTTTGPTGRVPGRNPSQGDFISVASTNATAFATWTDSRWALHEAGNQDIYLAALGFAN